MTLPIDMISDVVCPWCFIGKRRLEKAIALKPEIPVELHFRPYFLNPWIPREGISREEYLTTKFGSPNATAALRNASPRRPRPRGWPMRSTASSVSPIRSTATVSSCGPVKPAMPHV